MSVFDTLFLYDTYRNYWYFYVRITKKRENKMKSIDDIEEQVENDENVKTRIKAFAVFVKSHFDKRNF